MTGEVSDLMVPLSTARHGILRVRPVNGSTGLDTPSQLTGPFLQQADMAGCPYV
jgi:hypothetical protein